MRKNTQTLENIKFNSRTEFGTLLKTLGLFGSGVEIGVQKGDFSAIVRSEWKGRELHLVDRWGFDPDYDDIANVSEEEQSNLYLSVLQRFSDDKGVHIHRMESTRAAEMFPDEYFDWIYLDADHSYEGCKRDLKAWYPKLKPGGILAGHDFIDGNIDAGDFGVKSAVLEFIEDKKAPLHVSQDEWPSWLFMKQLQEKRAIVTMAIGEHFQNIFYTYFYNSLKEYSEKINTPLFVITEPLDNSEISLGRSPAWQKLLIFEHPDLKKFDRLLWIDSDIFITKNARNIFEYVPKGFWGGVTENINGTPKTDIEFVYNDRGILEISEMLNTGVLVLDRHEHSQLLRKIYYEDWITKSEYEKNVKGWFEQPFLSHALLTKSNGEIIPIRFNRLINRHLEIVGRNENTFRELLNKNDFLHWAGRTHDEHLRNDFKIINSILYQENKISDSNDYPGLFIEDKSTQKLLDICIVTEEFFGPFKNGGIGTGFTVLAEKLKNDGHNITILFVTSSPCQNETFDFWIEYYNAKGMKFIPLELKNEIKFDGSEYLAKNYYAYNWLKKNHFDLIHFTDYHTFGYYAVLAKKQGIAFQNTLLSVIAGGPTSYLLEADYNYLDNISLMETEFIERKTVENADIFISPSKFLIDWMIEHEWILPKKTFVQQNIVPSNQYKTNNRKQDEKIKINEIVFFGRLQGLKGIQLFCDSISKLNKKVSNRKIKITFMGKHAFVDNQKSQDYLRANLNCWSFNTQIIDNFNQKEAIEYLSSGNKLAVIPSKVENSPFVVIECQEARIPFIASNVGGIPELIKEEDKDIVLFERTIGDLTNKLIDILRNGMKVTTARITAQEKEDAWLNWHKYIETSSQQIDIQISKNELPLVSACIVHYNRPKFLEQALNSIMEQDYPNYEVIIVDDGSKNEDAIEYLDSLEPMFASKGWQIIRQENKYLGAARNTAAKNARGKYVLFLDDDDIAKPNKISMHVKVALHTNAKAVTCGNDYFIGTEPPNQNDRPSGKWIPIGPSIELGLFKNVYGGVHALVDREMFLSVGGYTELRGIGFEDWEFWSKIVLKGYKLEMVPECLTWYRVTPSSMIKTTNMYLNYKRAIKPFLEQQSLGLKNILNFSMSQYLAASKIEGYLYLSNQNLQFKSELLQIFSSFTFEEKSIAREKLLNLIKKISSIENIDLFYDVLLYGSLIAIQNQEEEIARSILSEAEKMAFRQKSTHVLGHIKSLKNLMIAPAKARINSKSQENDEMQNKNRISVVIPCYNHGRYLKDSVESVIKQTYDAFEIIIVNDGSTDNTIEVANHLIQKFGNYKIKLVNKENGGLSSARNEGIRNSNCEYFLPLDADDKISPTFLEKAISILESNQKVGFVYSHIQHFGIRTDVYELPEFNKDTLLHKDNIVAVCSLTRKKVWEMNNGYNENMKEGYEDWDFWVGAIKNGWTGYRIDEPLFLYRKHVESMLSESNKKRERLIATIVKNHSELYENEILDWANSIINMEKKSTVTDKKIVITYLINSILGITGGNQTLLYQVNELAKSGFDVNIVTYTDKPEGAYIRANVIKVPQNERMKKYIPKSNIIISTYFLNTMELEGVQANLKIYFAQGDQFIFGKRNENLTGKDLEIYNNLKKISKGSYNIKDVIFVPNSKNLAAKIKDKYKKDYNEILPVGIDDSVYYPLEKNNSKPVILVVGPDKFGSKIESLEFKGIKDIRESLEILRNQNIQFDVIRISNSDKEIFYNFDCEFYKAPSEIEKTKLFGKADILIYASHYDSCPLPPLEAMSAGVAVVCTATDGAKEYCIDRVNSLLVPIKNPSRIASAMEELINNNALRAELIKNGFETAEKYSRSNQIEILIQIFKNHIPDQKIQDYNKNIKLEYILTKIDYLVKNNEYLLAFKLGERLISNYIEEKYDSDQFEEILIFVANLALVLKNFESAHNYFEKVLNINPNSSSACYGLAEVFYSAEMFSEAKTMLEYAVIYDDNNKNARLRLKEVNQKFNLHDDHNSLLVEEKLELEK